MLYEIIGGIAALLAIIAGVMLFLRVMRREAEAERREERDAQKGQAGGEFAVGCGALVLVGLAVLAIMSVHPVDAGFVGVVTSGGKVQADTMKPGWNVLPPFLFGVTNVDTRVHGIPFGDVDPAKRFGAASREYQDVFLQGTLNIHVDQDKAVDLYQKVGLDYDQKLVIPFFSTAIKEVVPRYAIGDILANREEIRKATVTKLQEKLAPYGIVVDDVAIANIEFSDQYKQAIEAKQVAEQQVQTETQILAQKKIQADQARATAQGQADSSVIAAKGQAEANRLVQQSLSDQLIRYALVQKLGPTISTVILPDGQSFILDPKGLVKQ